MKVYNNDFVRGFLKKAEESKEKSVAKKIAPMASSVGAGYLGAITGQHIGGVLSGSKIYRDGLDTRYLSPKHFKPEQHIRDIQRLGRFMAIGSLLGAAGAGYGGYKITKGLLNRKKDDSK
jgi:hypothetical protein